MITGVNSDVRYRGVAFHVQTEDSGRDHPHVISHLYHGGRILASEKSDYEDQLDAEGLDEHVRCIVEKQHRSMLQDLAAGRFDALLEERLGESLEERGASPSLVDCSDSSELSRSPALFGELDSEPRPLHELILEHLEEGARRRAAAPAPGKVLAQG